MSTVYYRRASLTRLLRQELSSKFLVVPTPDHPLLIRGPDVIVSAVRSIFAIFTPSARERHSHLLLKSRLILCRLALPPHARCVLVIEAGDEFLGQLFTNDFAEIIKWSARSRIIPIIENSNFVGRHRDIPTDIAKETQVRFGNAMSVMRTVAGLSHRPFSAAFGDEGYIEAFENRPVSGIRLPSRRPTISRDTVDLEGVAFSEMSDIGADTTTVRNLVDDQAAHVYSLDNGIPYTTEEATGMAVINDWPIGYRDPNKLIHAAAFAGWAFVLDKNRNELRRFARRLKYGYER